jgi:hypothetical protein
MILLLGKHQFTVSSIDVCQKATKSSPRSTGSAVPPLLLDDAKDGPHLSRTAGPRDLKAAVTERNLTDYLKAELKAADHRADADGVFAGPMDGAVLSQIVNEAENFLSMMESVSGMSHEEQAAARLVGVNMTFGTRLFIQ